MHRNSTNDYFIYHNHYSSGCDSIMFGNKVLKPSEDTTGRIFIIRNVKYDALHKKAKIELFLPGDNMLANGQFTPAGKEWDLENLSYCLTEGFKYTDGQILVLTPEEFFEF